MKEGQSESNSVEQGSTGVPRQESESQVWTPNSSTWYQPQHAAYVSPNGTMHYNQEYAVTTANTVSSPGSSPSEGSVGGMWSSGDEEWLGRVVS